MNMYEEKIGLLLEMIAFATVDGELHKREYEFLSVIANEFKIEKTIFNDLFHQDIPQKVVRSEFERIKQFYRLALIMHSDGVLHAKEESAILHITLNMGLNPAAIKRILTMMKSGSNPLIQADVLLNVFQEQHN